MCGRFVLSSPKEVIEEVFGVTDAGIVDARFNVAPAQTVPVVLEGPHGRGIRRMRWGLTPRWAKMKRGPRGGAQVASFLNARSETISTKPSFREAFAQRRCLLPANAFYEWQHTKSGKIPHAIGLAGSTPFAMAGIWEPWVSAEGELREGVCVVTTRANAEMQNLHERMPVLIHRDHYEFWLRNDTPPALLRGLMEPIPEGILRVYPVGDEVNRADAEGPSLLAPRSGSR